MGLTASQGQTLSIHTQNYSSRGRLVMGLLDNLNALTLRGEHRDIFVESSHLKASGWQWEIYCQISLVWPYLV